MVKGKPLVGSEQVSDMIGFTSNQGDHSGEFGEDGCRVLLNLPESLHEEQTE